tara:strand:- start:1037 stop:2422 length:1386 start_codon:yes stop_codon:yes gene_type:complete
MVSLHFLDWAIITTYFLFILWVGVFKFKKKLKNENQFILSGRKLSLVGFIATLVTTWYGGILGVGENTLLYGVQTWFIFALPYYFFAVIYAFLVAPKIREKGFLSLPDHFHNSFGEHAGITSALIISFLASPAPYILSLGIILQFLFGIELGLSLLISTFVSIVYIWNGGFSAIVATDRIQFILMFIGFISLFIFLYIANGSPIKLIHRLPPSMLDPLGGNSLQYLLVWFFIASWTFIDPGFYQRCSAAKNPNTAKKGILLSIFFWAIFDFLTLICGLYAIETISPHQALLTYPIIAFEILPSGFLGIFLVGIIAIVMSTIDSLSLVSAITFGRDILWRIETNKSTLSPINFMKKGLIIISFFSLIISYVLPSVVALFYTLGSLLIPGLILPFLYSLKLDNQTMDKNITVWMILPIIISGSWFIFSKLMNQPLLRLEPFYPGMATSFLYYIVIKIKVNYGN